MSINTQTLSVRFHPDWHSKRWLNALYETTFCRCFLQGGEVPRSTEARHVMKTPAIHRAVQELTNPAPFVPRQRDDYHVGQVKRHI